MPPHMRRAWLLLVFLSLSICTDQIVYFNVFISELRAARFKRNVNRMHRTIVKTGIANLEVIRKTDADYPVTNM